MPPHRTLPWVVLFLLPGCGDSAPPAANPRTAPAEATSEPLSETPPAPLTWPEQAAARGLTYVNHSGGPAKQTILEAGGAGVALLDLDADGDLDVVLAQGLESLKQSIEGPGADLEIFRNNGNGHFERAPGPGIVGWWTGLATGDINGDGRTDLVASGFGCIEVLMQTESGALESWQSLISHAEGADLVQGEERPMGHPPSWSTSVALFDADGDGHLDLYVGRYLKLDPVNPAVVEISRGQLTIPCTWKGHDVHCGPQGLKPLPDQFFFGSGKAGFVEAPASLPDHEAGYTMALLPSDVDGDGDTDLLVANDRSPNLLLRNNGAGIFTDSADEAGFALSADGDPEAGMGLAAGDVNRDGVLDYVVTNFSDEPTGLYFGSALGFTNQTFRYALGRESRPLLSWGVHLEDFDGDGWLELFTANGHVHPQADLELTGTSYAQRDTLWALGPEPQARRLGSESPQSLFGVARVSRGSATGDINGDGRVDLIVTTIDGPCALGINNSGIEQHRLTLQLSGAPLPPGKPAPGKRRTPRDAMGARVVLVVRAGTEEFALQREVQTCQGYQSASSSSLHFGLGSAESYQQLRIQWPSGAVTELPPGPADRTLHIEEGRGIVREEEWR